jgi:hypothetical protein
MAQNRVGFLPQGRLILRRIYGITCLQGYIYYTENSSGDKRRLKTFVEISDFSMLRSNFDNEVVFTWQVGVLMWVFFRLPF